MPNFFKSLKGGLSSNKASGSSSGSTYNYYPEVDAPPQWAPAPEKSHTDGRYADASRQDYLSGEQFCLDYPPQPPRIVPSNAVDAIRTEGCRAWGLEIPHSMTRFRGQVTNIQHGGSKSPPVVHARTDPKCGEICLLSDLPLVAGLYDIQGKQGVYYEIKVIKMDGIIAIGTACRPYPAWRFPGWNRLSGGLHLDDMRKFFEDPDGGRDYAGISRVSSGDIIGCGYEFSSGSLFFTYNGVRLAEAFGGVYLPRNEHDVFAAIGVEQECEFEVNFGGDYFKWAEGNEWQWKVDGLVGRLSDTARFDDELPAYTQRA